MNSPSKLFPNPAEKYIQSTKRKSRNSQNYRIFLITTWFSVEVAGVEPASKQGTRKLSTRLAAI